jgi:hypothetical protein
MFRSLIRLALAFVTFVLIIPNTFAHDAAATAMLPVNGAAAMATVSSSRRNAS